MAAVDPPAQKGQKASSDGGCAHFDLCRREIGAALGFDQAAGDAPFEIALSEVVKVGQEAGVGQGAQEFVLVADMVEHFCNRNQARRAIFALGERGAHVLEKLLELAEKQVVLIAIVRIKGRSADEARSRTS